MNESLQKLDLTLDSSMRKTEKQAYELGAEEIKIDTQRGKQDVKSYVEGFTWNDQKYPRAKALHDIAQYINDKMKQVDNDLKRKSDELNETR